MAPDIASLPVPDPAPAVDSVAPQAVLALAGVSKRYGVTRALDDMSFELRAGEVHALCGHNGAGKSTLVKVLAGLVVPDCGEVEVHGESVQISNPTTSQRLGIAVVEQELALAETLSVADNVFLGHPSTPWFYRRQRHAARTYLDQVGLEDVDPDTPLGELTLGQRQLVEIARLLAREARILILDEPTATLSREEIDRVFAVVKRLVQGGCAAIFVTHRLGEVFEFCDRVTVVKDGRAVATHPTSSIDRATLVGLMVEGEPVTVAPAAAVDKTVAPVLDVRGLEVPGAVHDFSLVVRPGQIVALAGQMGAGATEALRALAGLDPSASGEVDIRGRRLRLGDRRRAVRSGIAYVSEDRAADGLFFGRSAQENLTPTALPGLQRWGWVSHASLQRKAALLGAAAHFDADKLQSTPQMLSGGNQQKLLMGRCLTTHGKDSTVLLLSEPTRGVDIHSRHEIYQVLRQAADQGAAVLFASTDLEEIFELADVVYTMFRGRIEGRYQREEATMTHVLADMTHGAAGALANRAKP